MKLISASNFPQICKGITLISRFFAAIPCDRIGYKGLENNTFPIPYVKKIQDGFFYHFVR